MPDGNEASRIVNSLTIEFDKDETRDLLEHELRRATEDWKKQNGVYPHEDGEYMVLGPDIFTDGTVLCWRGEIFTSQGYLPCALPNAPGSES